MHAERPQHLIEFYAILDRLETRVGGARKLVDCRGRMTWPQRGVNFFREPGELCTDSGAGPSKDCQGRDARPPCGIRDQAVDCLELGHNFHVGRYTLTRMGIVTLLTSRGLGGAQGGHAAPIMLHVGRRSLAARY
jgi:hypothetical protein